MSERSFRGADLASGPPARTEVVGGERAALLLHDGSSALDAAGEQVVLGVLPELLQFLARRGLTPRPFQNLTMFQAANEEIKSAYSQQYVSYLLADELRQSSDEFRCGYYAS